MRDGRTEYRGGLEVCPADVESDGIPWHCDTISVPGTRPEDSPCWTHMRYLVGIDLGTTNSALAYIDLQNRPKVGNLGLKTFPTPQLVAPGQVGERPLLPSFLYIPGQHDLPPGSVALPWDANAAYAVGEFARTHGAKVPGRLVSSAKSWLCHAGVDRTAPLLPWTAPPDLTRLSPLEVSTRY